MNLTERLIAEEEGREACVYPDSTPERYLTIGIGAVVDKRLPGSGLCDAAIDAQFEHDSAEARAIAARFPHFAELSEVRQAVLISMAFQLGSKPLYWPHFMAALEARDYELAAAAGLDSDWARIQAQHRAQREMRMLDSDIWTERT